MRSLGLSLSGLACVVALIVIAPKPANSQPSVLPLASSASGVEEVGYYYRRYRRPYYNYGYGYRRPYYGYGGYGYRRPYYGYGGYGYRRPYFGFGYRRWR
jgi:hypothetical protein